MNSNDPVAFLSYVRADDEHDRGRITALRCRLEGEVRMHTGKPFRIFQDRRDLSWGQNWRERLDSTLLSVTFLIPVITPSYFYSNACRDEFEKFLLREKQLGENRLILPIYYLDADQINDSANVTDDMARIVASRNWSDWRSLRFRDLVSPEVESSVSEMARIIKSAMKEMEGIIFASKSVQISPSITTGQIEPNLRPKKIDLKTFSPSVITKKMRSTILSQQKSTVEYPYYVFTKDFDEELNALDLADEEDLKRLGSTLRKRINVIYDKYTMDLQKFVKDISGISNADLPAVTLLLDNSGSLRGENINEVAAWSYIISEKLEAVGIATEVLGFTTRAWKGGQSRERWLSSGKPKSPGRLNDLRHIVYKQYLDNIEDALPKIALMLREGLLKENIDGEAILWACKRDLPRRCNKRIIVVVSDGAPVDDSTLSVNDGSFLINHLSSVVQWAETQKNIKICAVGLEYSCDKYYTESVTANPASKLGDAFMGAFPKWLRAKF